MSKQLKPFNNRKYLVLAMPRIPKPIRNFSLVAILLVGSNLLSHRLFNPKLSAAETPALTENQKDLYLLDKAQQYIYESERFAQKVRKVARDLEIPAAWLMAVMYAESGFNPSVKNLQGSGAVGLIQFMPTTARMLDISVDRLAAMNAVDQMDYVYKYLQRVRKRYGNYQSLTDLYLGILYPKGRSQDYCYTLYSEPSRAYRQNKGLDEDKDGRVTVTDIDKRLKRLFPTAYHLGPESITN